MRAIPTRSSLAVALLAVVLHGAGCSSSGSANPPNDLRDPVFTDPLAKLAQTGDTESFAGVLFTQYTWQDPYLVDSSVPPEIYMAFFGGPSNRGRALAFLDNTNWYGTQPGHVRAKAIWIMGSGDWQYAAYRLANESERWSERSTQEAGDPPGNRVTLHGQVFVDPFPVTRAQNRQIWVNYSKAYAMLARYLHASGRVVHARAFLAGAGASSVVWEECRAIRDLVAEGSIADFQCNAVDFPVHDVPAHWTDCPADCAPPPAAEPAR